MLSSLLARMSANKKSETSDDVSIDDESLDAPTVIAAPGGASVTVEQAFIDPPASESASEVSVDEQQPPHEQPDPDLERADPDVEPPSQQQQPDVVQESQTAKRTMKRKLTDEQNADKPKKKKMKSSLKKMKKPDEAQPLADTTEIKIKKNKKKKQLEPVAAPSLLHNAPMKDTISKLREALSWAYRGTDKVKTIQTANVAELAKMFMAMLRGILGDSAVERMCDQAGVREPVSFPTQQNPEMKKVVKVSALARDQVRVAAFSLVNMFLVSSYQKASKHKHKSVSGEHLEEWLLDIKPVLFDESKLAAAPSIASS